MPIIRNETTKAIINHQQSSTRLIKFRYINKPPREFSNSTKLNEVFVDQPAVSSQFKSMRINYGLSREIKAKSSIIDTTLFVVKKESFISEEKSVEVGKRDKSRNNLHECLYDNLGFLFI